MYICVFVYLLICVFVRLHTCVFVFLCLFVSYIQKAGILGILPIILTNIRNLANRKTTLLWDNLVWYLIVILAKHPTPFPGMFSSWYIIIPQLCFHKFFAFENDLRITLEHKFHSCNSSFGFGSRPKRSFVNGLDMDSLSYGLCPVVSSLHSLSETRTYLTILQFMWWAKIFVSGIVPLAPTLDYFLLH